MLDDQIYLFDGVRRLVLITPLTNNKTFKNWFWHHMYKHLNFRSLSMLNTKKMVYDKPQIKKPSRICEECCIAKQARSSFKHDLHMKSSDGFPRNDHKPN